MFEVVDLPLHLENPWLDYYNELDIQKSLTTPQDPPAGKPELVEGALAAEVDVSGLPIFDGDMEVYNNTAGLNELTDLPRLDAPSMESSSNQPETFEDIPTFPGDGGSMIGGELHRSLEELETQEWDGGFMNLPEPESLNLGEIPEVPLPYGLPEVDEDLGDPLPSDYVW